ncbi:MAG TPA: DUF1007 family protein [Xanthobacteraceae bacterium]|nr:DUF1007 family protein [Xanthobacteraceae bacterium]
MMNPLKLVLALVFSLAAVPAFAHPHVWVTMQSELVYAPDGSITGIRHAWTFDDVFSTYATQGLPQATKGQFTREELAALAKENVESLKEYSFFNYARVEGARKKDAFIDPTEYWLDYKDESLTLNFTLPFKTPVKAKDLLIDIYDPEFFVSFEFGESDPVKLAGAPAACKFEIMRPNDNQFPSSQRLDKNLRESTENQGMGQLYANKIAVKCP